MARLHLSRPLNVIIITLILIEVQGNHRNKRNTDVKCHQQGRFYRNPDRQDSTIWTVQECSKYYLCLEGDVFEFHCSAGLLFDVNRQLCDMQLNVHNCDVTTEKLVPKPLLSAAKCANDTHLSCADSNCIPVEYFCDGSIDCQDSSDEGWCDMSYDPNAALPCDTGLCQLPNCFCSKDGTETPGNIVRNQIPQMITLTFDGPVNHENWDAYSKILFNPDRKNPNGCPIRGTFFVSHPYTNYRHVQKLWNDGHEIAVNSITRRGPAEWWSKNATVEDWFDEMVGQANVINRFSTVRMEDFRGMRSPFLSVGWNRQFLMMQEFGFEYDATVVAPLSDPPLWPYTLDYEVPHKCTGQIDCTTPDAKRDYNPEIMATGGGINSLRRHHFDGLAKCFFTLRLKNTSLSRNNQYCPTRSYAGLWEMVINPLSNGQHTCATLEYCPSTFTSDHVFDILVNNFKRHYMTNRAPFGIHLYATWFKNTEYLEAVQKFISELANVPDVYFVTYKDVIEWMKRPTPILQMKTFAPWQCKERNFKGPEVACAKPTTCKLQSKVLQHDKYMITCTVCPKSYPWIRNEFGFD